MMIYAQFVALCLFTNGAAAFSFAPASKSTSALKSTTYTEYVAEKASPTETLPAGDIDGQFARGLSSLPEPTTVQGGALRTWSFKEVERLVVSMTANDESLYDLLHEGRLLNAKVELCEGPNNTPLRMVIKSGKGKLRPFKAVIETPSGHGSLFIRNIGELEFPFIAAVKGAVDDVSGDENSSVGPTGNPEDAGVLALSKAIYGLEEPRILQGGSVHTYPLPPSIDQVRVCLKTDGRPLNAIVELVQGPNAVKTTIDLYSEDGELRPFFAVMHTPGNGNVVRIINTAPMEFPLMVEVLPFNPN